MSRGINNDIKKWSSLHCGSRGGGCTQQIFIWGGYPEVTLAPGVCSQNTYYEINCAYGLIRLPRWTSGCTSQQPHFHARNQFRIWTGSLIGYSHICRELTLWQRTWLAASKKFTTRDKKPVAMFITNNIILGYNLEILAFMFPFGSVAKQSSKWFKQTSDNWINVARGRSLVWILLPKDVLCMNVICFLLCFVLLVSVLQQAGSTVLFAWWPWCWILTDSTLAWVQKVFSFFPYSWWFAAQFINFAKKCSRLMFCLV